MDELEYQKRRVLILEQALRNMMGMLCVTNPAAAAHFDEVGRAWDRELDHLDRQRPIES